MLVDICMILCTLSINSTISYILLAMRLFQGVLCGIDTALVIAFMREYFPGEYIFFGGNTCYLANILGSILAIAISFPYGFQLSGTWLWVIV